MTNPITPAPALPAQLRATVFSEAWWATHLAAGLAFFVAVVSVLRPAWLHEAQSAQAWIAPIAMFLGVLSVFGYLVFALIHHKISRATFVADVEAELPGLKNATQVLLPLVDQVAPLKAALDAVAGDITTVKAQMAAQPAAADIGTAVRAELAKLSAGGQAPPLPVTGTPPAG